MICHGEEKIRKKQGLFNSRIALAIIIAIGLCPVTRAAQAASGPHCDPNAVAGNPCNLPGEGLGQTVMDCAKQNVLACLNPPGQSTGQRWYIAGTDTIPNCTTVGDMLQFNGNTIQCAQNVYPTCAAGQSITFNGTTLVCMLSPTPTPTPVPTPVPTATPTSTCGSDCDDSGGIPTPAATPVPTATYTTNGMESCSPPGGCQLMYDPTTGNDIEEQCTPTGWVPSSSCQ